MKVKQTCILQRLNKNPATGGDILLKNVSYNEFIIYDNKIASIKLNVNDSVGVRTIFFNPSAFCMSHHRLNVR